MTPVMSIDYRGRRGPGLLGPGWNITGMSAVVRCRRDVAHDGDNYIGNVENGVPRFLSDSALCLDGMRMIHKPGTGESPGVTGAEYYSESGPPTKLVVDSHDFTSGPLNLGQPVSFRAYYPDGRIGYYGITPASRIEANNRRYAFYVERIEDRFGNSIRFSYTRAAASTPADPMRVVEPMPDKITYTGQGATGGDHELAFTYIAAAKNRLRYIESLSIETKTVLSSIAVSSKYASFDSAGAPVNGVVRFYNFSYDTSSGTGFSVLKQIQKCTATTNSSGGAVPDVCTSPTAITWSANSGTPSYERIALDGINDIIPAGAQNYGHITVADVDNDGRDDIVYKVTGDARCARWVYRLSTGRGFGPPVNLSTTMTCSSPSSTVGSEFAGDIFPVDLDGKGAIDFVAPRILAGAPFNGFSGLLSKPLSPTGIGYQIFDLDKNANTPSLTDTNIGFGRVTPLHTAVLRPSIASANASSGTWFAQEVGLDSLGAPVIARSTNVGVYLNKWPPVFMDLNGDGLDEFITPDSQVSIFADTPVSVASNLPVLRSGNTVTGRFWFMDVNGDGLKDVAYISTSDTGPGRTVHVRLNQGDYTFGKDIGTGLSTGLTAGTGENIGVSGIASGIDTGVRIADVNLDGIDDMLLVDNGAYLTSGSVSNGTFGASRSRVVALISQGDGRFSSVTPIQLGTTTPLPLGDPATGFNGVAAPLQGYRLTETLDADGDGLTDLVQTEGGRLRLYLRSGVPPRWSRASPRGRRGRSPTR